MAEARVLVVDDEPMVRDVLERYLADEGFAVRPAADGEARSRPSRDATPDLVLLDLMLPKVDGFEVFRRIRATAATPVIMLTARGEETDRIVGLELGADDYVTKPFTPARGRRTHPRRAAAGARPERDERARSARASTTSTSICVTSRDRVAGQMPCSSRRKEFDLLSCTWRRTPGVTFTRTQLLDDVWDLRVGRATPPP